MPNKARKLNLVPRHIDFVYTEMLRADITVAFYNPRRITDKNKAALKKSINRFGMVESFVLNKQTGNLVSGHQRLAQLDAKYKTDQYIVGVNVIDISDKEEIALNIVLNNKNLQGEYDESLLAELKETIDLKVDGLFDEKDMEMIFGFDSTIVQELVHDDFRNAMNRNEAAQSKQDESDVNYNRTQDKKKLTIVFESNRERNLFDRLLHRDETEPFISGYVLLEIIKKGLDRETN